MAYKIGNTGPLLAVSSGAQLVRTSTGVLYAVINPLGGARFAVLRIFKSTDNGVSWFAQDITAGPNVNTNTASVAATIDGNGIIHVAYNAAPDGTGFSHCWYVTFSTVTDKFGVTEYITSVSGVTTAVAISVDNNNYPHVAWDDSANFRYTNRVGGFWKPTSIVLNTADHRNIDIQIDQNNIPQISAANTAASSINVFLGNKNNASSFTTTTIASGGATNTPGGGSSLVIDLSGNTWVAYQSSNDGPILLAKHLKTDVWSTWQTAVTNGYNGKNVSLAADTNDIYVFYERNAGGIAYDRYDTVNGKWLGEQIVQANTLRSTTNIRYHNPLVKWSQYFNNGDTGANNSAQDTIEYLFDDGATVYYDKLVTAQIATGLFQINPSAPGGVTTTSTSSTSSSTSTSISTSSTSTSVSTSSTSTSISTSSTSSSISTSSTSQSTSTSISTSSTSTSTSASTSVSSTSSSTSISTSSTSTSRSTSSTSSSTSVSTSSTSSSTSISTSSTSTSTSISTSSTSTSISTSSTSTSTSQSTSISTSSTSISTSSTSTSTSVSFTTSTSSTSTSISTSSTSTSLSTSSTSSSTSISTSSTSTSVSTSSTSKSTSTSSTSTSKSTSTSSTSSSISTSSTSSSTSISTSSTSRSTSTSSTSTSVSSSTSISSTSSSTSTTVSTTTSTSSTSVSTSSTSTSTSTTTIAGTDVSMVPRMTIYPDTRRMSIITNDARIKRINLRLK